MLGFGYVSRLVYNGLSDPRVENWFIRIQSFFNIERRPVVERQSEPEGKEDVDKDVDKDANVDNMTHETNHKGAENHGGRPG